MQVLVILINGNKDKKRQKKEQVFQNQTSNYFYKHLEGTEHSIAFVHYPRGPRLQMIIWARNSLSSTAFAWLGPADSHREERKLAEELYTAFQPILGKSYFSHNLQSNFWWTPGSWTDKLLQAKDWSYSLLPTPSLQCHFLSKSNILAS